MDPNTPTPAAPQPNDGLIMPELDQPQVTAEPTAIPVTTPTPIAVTTTPAPAPAMDAVTAAPTPAPVTPVAPEPIAAPTPDPIPEPEADPLFAPVTEPDPLDVNPEPVAPTPTAPVTDQTMNRLDDGAKPVVAAVTGQTVIASTTKPQKSRRKTMIILLIGLIALAGVGYGVYTYFMKPNVAKVETPTVLAVDQLSPENLTQATDKGDLAAGSQTNSTVIIMSGKVPADAPDGLKLEVEVQPLGTDFTGTPTEDTVAVPDETDPMKVTLKAYPEGSYHWRGRLSDGTSQGPWTAYNTGDDAGKTADFTVDRTVPTAALLKTLNGKAVTTKAVTSTVAQPVLTGTAEAGSNITVAFGEITYKAAAGADGTWTVTAGAVLANGKYTLTITSADTAGNATASAYTLTQAAK